LGKLYSCGFGGPSPGVKRCVSAGYRLTVRFGRGPTKGGGGSGGESLKDRILQWIKDKPVIASPDSRGRIPSDKSLAFMIARSIHQKGTLAYPGPTGVLSSVITQERIDKFVKEFANDFFFRSSSEIFKEIK